MLKVINKENNVDITPLFNFGEIPTVPFIIEASGEQLDHILDNFSGIKKTSSTDLQIFIGEDSEFILRNWNYV